MIDHRLIRRTKTSKISLLYLVLLLFSCPPHYEVHARGRMSRINNRTVVTNDEGSSSSADDGEKEVKTRNKLPDMMFKNRTTTQNSQTQRNKQDGKHPSCSDSAPQMSRIKRLLRRKESKTAYQMMVLSALAYWEFHRLPIHTDVPGFRLQNDIALYKRNRKFHLVRTVRIAYCHIRRRISSLAQSFGRIFQRGRRRGREKSSDLATIPNAAATATATTTTTHRRRQRQRREKSGNTSTNSTSPSCHDVVKNKCRKGQLYKFEYYFRDWHEITKVPHVHWHDTDLLVSSSGDGTLALAFAGTQSAADHMTNLQSFEPVAHSGLFHAGKNLTIQGNIHRGFLNAYSRVERGSVLRLCQNCSDGKIVNSKILQSMHIRYSNCSMDNYIRPRKEKKKRKRSNATVESENNANETTQDERGKEESIGKGSGCRVHGEKLMDVLRELVTTALSAGRTVHLTGHSLGGGLTTVLALDVIINFPEVPINRLHVWTFGAPQVVDEAFLRSATEVSQRLHSFIRDGRNRRFHRFVTLSDDCKEDFIPNMVSKVATPKQNLRGRASRRLSGIKGSVVHVASPRYIPPDNTHPTNTTRNDGEAVPSSPTTIKSTVAAHFGSNYLRGISRQSMDHPLISDLPEHVRDIIGELEL